MRYPMSGRPLSPSNVWLIFDQGAEFPPDQEPLLWNQNLPTSTRKKEKKKKCGFDNT